MSEYSAAYAVRESVSRWQSVLAQLRIENIRMKYELSGIIKKDIDTDFLEKAENFQQRFLQKDQLMDLLRLDLNQLLHQLDDTEKVPPSYLQIRQDMEKLILEFNILSNYFHTFALATDANA
ncbi:MAG TPA: hypothetical protein VL092_11770 [Chitinophagaceae bacterium]|nr:hypothetical protein [Chitinophagaceae bacterium]